MLIAVAVMATAFGCGRWEFQHWANEAGLDVTVCHYPPGTSKWNKIEHRLFSEGARRIGGAVPW